MFLVLLQHLYSVLYADFPAPVNRHCDVQPGIIFLQLIDTVMFNQA